MSLLHCKEESFDLLNWFVESNGKKKLYQKLYFNFFFNDHSLSFTFSKNLNLLHKKSCCHFAEMHLLYFFFFLSSYPTNK